MLIRSASGQDELDSYRISMNAPADCPLPSRGHTQTWCRADFAKGAWLLINDQGKVLTSGSIDKVLETQKRLKQAQLAVQISG